MKRLAGIVCVVGAVAAGALGGGVAGASGVHAKAKACTGGFTEARTASEVTVSGDTCATARTVAERAVGIAPRGCVKVLDRKGKIGFKRPCKQLSYTCTSVPTNQHKALKVTCVRGSRTIRFRY